MMLYARYEPTTDRVILQHYPEAAKEKRDVQLYKDRACTEPYARFMWYSGKKPMPWETDVVVNCAHWELQWIEGE